MKCTWKHDDKDVCGVDEAKVMIIAAIMSVMMMMMMIVEIIVKKKKKMVQTALRKTKKNYSIARQR